MGQLSIRPLLHCCDMRKLHSLPKGVTQTYSWIFKVWQNHIISTLDLLCKAAVALLNCLLCCWLLCTSCTSSLNLFQIVCIAALARSLCPGLWCWYPIFYSSAVGKLYESFLFLQLVFHLWYRNENLLSSFIFLLFCINK